VRSYCSFELEHLSVLLVSFLLKVFRNKVILPKLSFILMGRVV